MTGWACAALCLVGCGQIRHGDLDASLNSGSQNPAHDASRDAAVSDDGPSLVDAAVSDAGTTRVDAAVSDAAVPAAEGGAETFGLTPFGVDSRACGVPHAWTPPKATEPIMVLRGGDGFVALVEPRTTNDGRMFVGVIAVLGASGEVLRVLANITGPTPRRATCSECILFDSFRAQVRADRLVVAGYLTTSIEKGGGSHELLVVAGDSQQYREAAGFMMVHDALLPAVLSGGQVLWARALDQVSEPEWEAVNAIELTEFDVTFALWQRSIERTPGYMPVDMVLGRDDRIFILEQRVPGSPDEFEHSGASRVLVLDGAKWNQLASWTAPADVTLEALALDSEDRVLIVGRRDDQRGTVGFFDLLDGTTLRPAWSEPHLTPELGAISAVTWAPGGDWYLDGTGGLQRFSADGTPRSSPVPGISNMTQLAVQSDGSLFATDGAQAFVYCE